LGRTPNAARLAHFASPLTESMRRFQPVFGLSSRATWRSQSLSAPGADAACGADLGSICSPWWTSHARSCNHGCKNQAAGWPNLANRPDMDSCSQGGTRRRGKRAAAPKRRQALKAVTWDIWGTSREFYERPPGSQAGTGFETLELNLCVRRRCRASSVGLQFNVRPGRKGGQLSSVTSSHDESPTGAVPGARLLVYLVGQARMM